MNYVYKIINNLNGKEYIGKRQYDGDPVDDSYMGSGKLIKAAILKYGKENFTKEIIQIFETDAEAALLESKLVTVEFIKSGKSYNMHEGGHGGFHHIHSNPELKEKAQQAAWNAMKDTFDGKSHITPEGRQRFLDNYSFGARRRKGELPNFWETASEEEKENRRKIISENNTGSKNNNFGNVWCVETHANDLSGRKLFSKNNIPDGWISTVDWRDSKRIRPIEDQHYWFNNGTENFYLKLNDSRTESLIRGRLKLK